MTAIPFVSLEAPQYGESVGVSPLIRRVIADNPSKFTYHGTGTYIVGAGTDVAVIDPGPRLDAHRDALWRALDGRRVTAILVTHCHSDHSPLAAWLRDETGAPTIAFGPHPFIEDPDADDSMIESGEADPAAEPVKIEESIDLDFMPDIRVGHGELAARGSDWTVRAVHTPGHTSNHLCFALAEEQALFTGDHIMGWSTTVIAPPDGDMAAYLRSLEVVRGRDDRVFWPTHGAPVTDTSAYLDAFIAHRLDREANVLAAVRSGRSDVVDIVALLYSDVRVELHKPAGRSVLAHLIKLVDDGLVAVEDGNRPSLKAIYRPV